MHSFAKLSLEERLEFLKTIHKLTDEEISLLRNNICHDFKYSNTFIENAASYFCIPLGFLTNCTVNSKSYTVPIATEEASVIAALINANLYIKRHHGIITSDKISSDKIGQIQIPIIKNHPKLIDYISLNKERLISLANALPAKNMVVRGGGVKDLYLRNIERPNNSFMGIIHVVVDTVDAMGANTVNQICEFLKKIIIDETGEECNMAILSNLCDDIVHAKIVIPNVSETLGKKIENASIFSEEDIYRACTSNKGIMNGIDGILIATGNDFRAAEASIHAYAALNGKYTSLSRWRYSDQTLSGEFKAALSVGIVGGIIDVHPMSKLMLKVLNVSSANELACLCAAVGLMQNFAALKALCTEGIVKGHMNLHNKKLHLTDK